jgi:hypothetical protein
MSLVPGEGAPGPIRIDPAKGGVDRPSPVFDLKPQPWTRGDLVELDLKLKGRRIFMELNSDDDVQTVKNELEGIMAKAFELLTQGNTVERRT